jgi:hypothetical protein
MGVLAGPDLFTNRCPSDSEGRSAAASTLGNGLASTRNGRTRKTRRGDTGWLHRYGIRTKVLLRLVEISIRATSIARFERHGDVTTAIQKDRQFARSSV